MPTTLHPMSGTDETRRFVSCVQINMTESNLRRYEAYYQFHDPITPTLQKRRRATLVSEVMQHDRLVRTEFFNDFLKQDGLCFGLNYFAFDRGAQYRRPANLAQRRQGGLHAEGTHGLSTPSDQVLSMR